MYEIMNFGLYTWLSRIQHILIMLVSSYCFISFWPIENYVNRSFAIENWISKFHWSVLKSICVWTMFFLSKYFDSLVVFEWRFIYFATWEGTFWRKTRRREESLSKNGITTRPPTTVVRIIIKAYIISSTGTHYSHKHQNVFVLR